MRPEIDAATVRRELEAFDHRPCSPKWRGTGGGVSGQACAVRWNGRLYPAAEVLRRAVHAITGVWPVGPAYRSTRSAGSILARIGFTVVFAPFEQPAAGEVEVPHYTVVLEPDEDGWLARVPALGGAHAWGHTQEAALAEVRTVVVMIVEEYQDAQKRLPPDVTLHNSAA